MFLLGRDETPAEVNNIWNKLLCGGNTSIPGTRIIVEAVSCCQSITSLKGFMIFDLHVHTIRYSPCSRIHPADLLYTARLFGLDGIAITEHDYLWSEDEIRELRRDTGNNELIILRGQEIRTFNEDGPEGDVLVFGYPDTIDEGPITPKELLKLVHASGAVAIAAHPYRDFLGLEDKIFDLELDGIEIYNSNHSASSIRKAAHAQNMLSLAGIGASDAHDLVHIGHFSTLFERPIKNESELVEEIKGRRCKPISFLQSPLFTGTAT